MNNALLINEETPEPDISPLVRERAEQITLIIEAIQALLGSSHWKVLSKFVFDVELAKSKRRLENESDTTEIFRLQGETRLGRRYHLEKLLNDYRNELTGIRKKL